MTIQCHPQDHRSALNSRATLQHVFANLVAGYIARQDADGVSQTHAGPILNQRLDTCAAAAFNCQVQRSVAIDILDNLSERRTI